MDRLHEYASNDLKKVGYALSVVELGGCDQFREFEQMSQSETSRIGE